MAMIISWGGHFACPKLLKELLALVLMIQYGNIVVHRRISRVLHEFINEPGLPTASHVTFWYVKSSKHLPDYLPSTSQASIFPMTFSGTSDLEVVELIIYLVLFPITLYLGYLHGKTGFLGYFYLNTTCAVRIAADIVSLLPSNRDATHPTIAAAILSSIGLSPLLLALSGFLHESHVRLVEVTQGAGQVRKTKRWLWFIQIQIHGTSVLGMVLAIVAALKLVPSGTTITESEYHTDEKLRSAGAVILMVVWAFLAQYALYLIYVARNVRKSSSGRINFTPMLTWLAFAVPAAGLRCVSLILYAFDNKDTELNPMTGALWVKVIFIFLATLGAVVNMCISGWVSRNISNDPTLQQHGSANDVRYESVRADKE